MGFKLYIMRHAKSDWSGISKSDIERTINQRGQKNAIQIGQWMVVNDHLPEKIISSPAVRARQTIELVCEQLAFPQENIAYDKDLYLAGVDVLVESVQLYKSGVNSLMLVAHNPGLEQLVNDLLSRTVNPVPVGVAMTTANLAIFEFKDNDFEPETDQCTLVEFIKPKELA